MIKYFILGLILGGLLVGFIGYQQLEFERSINKADIALTAMEHFREGFIYGRDYQKLLEEHE